MGVFDFVGGIFGAASNLFGTSMTNKNNWNMQMMTNKMNREINRENNAFNAQQAQLDRDWMSYENQRKLMEKAGLNPMAMFSDGNLSAASTTAAAGSPIAMQAPQYQNPFSGLGFTDIANGLKALAEAEKIGGVDTRKAEAELNNIIESTEGQRIANKYAGRLNDMELKKGAALVDKIYKEADNLVKQGHLIEAERTLANAKQATEKEIKRLTGAKADYAEELANLAYESIMSDINSKKAQAYKDNTQGDLNKTTEKYVGYNAVTGRINANANSLSAQSSWENAKTNRAAQISDEHLNQIIGELKTTEISQLRYEIDKARKDAKYAKIFEDMNDLEIVRVMLQMKYFYQSIPILGNILDGISNSAGQEGVKSVAKKVVK